MANTPSYLDYLSKSNSRVSYKWHHKFLRVLEETHKPERWLLKDPSHLGNLEEILSFYPDACFIHICRDPAETLPSICSLTSQVRKGFTDSVDLKDLGTRSLEFWSSSNSKNEAQKQKIPSESYMQIQYTDLVNDPINLIQDIKKTSNTPIIMLTAMSEDNHKIDGLKTGTDDYLSKPFEPEELFLRINNLLKLYENINQAELLFSFGSFIYDTKTNLLKLNDKEIYLTEGENNLLLKLINNRNNTLSREELAEKDFDESELRKVDVGITRLRQKIEKIPKQPQYIKTIRGKGYMLICKEI